MVEIRTNLTFLPTDSTLEYVIDGGGQIITTGQQGFLEVPFGCNITRVMLAADRAATIIVDVWKTTFAAFPPSIANSIVASDFPRLSAAQSTQNTALTGWTRGLAQGDILNFVVSANDVAQRLTISFLVLKT